MAILLGSPNIVQKGIPESLHIFSFAKMENSSYFSYLLKPSDHLLKVNAEAENLANNDMPTAAQFDVKLTLDIEKIRK